MGYLLIFIICEAVSAYHLNSASPGVISVALVAPAGPSAVIIVSLPYYMVIFTIIHIFTIINIWANKFIFIMMMVIYTLVE